MVFDLWKRGSLADGLLGSTCSPRNIVLMPKTVFCHFNNHIMMTWVLIWSSKFLGQWNTQRSTQKRGGYSPITSRRCPIAVTGFESQPHHLRILPITTVSWHQTWSSLSFHWWRYLHPRWRNLETFSRAPASAVPENSIIRTSKDSSNLSAALWLISPRPVSSTFNHYFFYLLWLLLQH